MAASDQQLQSNAQTSTAREKVDFRGFRGYKDCAQESSGVRIWDTLVRERSGPAVILHLMSSSVMRLFEQTGAYLRGHFRLTSGLHSEAYLQCAKVLAYPAFAEQLGRSLAEQLTKLCAGKPDVVLAPAMGGLIIGHEVARAFNVPFLFTEREQSTGQMTLRRGFELKPGAKAVVIEDVITTGGSSREVIELIRAAGAEVLAAGSIIDRSNGKADLGVPRVALENLDVVAYDPNECALCRQGIPVVKPGSRT